MTRLKELKESPGYQLWVATNRWQRMFRKALAPLGLTHVQYIVLILVWRMSADTPNVTQAAVSRMGDLDPNMASQVVRSLVKRGLLVRDPHPEDGRAVVLLLTKTGLEQVTQARELIIPLVDKFFEPLGEEQMQLASMLRKLIEGSDHSN